MLRTTIFPGRYVQGKDALHRLGKALSRFGQKGMVLCAPFVYDKMLPDFREHIEKS